MLRPIDATSYNSKYTSRREAKELLKVGVKSIDNRITSGQLKATVRKQGNARLILIERDSLQVLKRGLDQSLYLKQVESLLGISHKRVLELINYSLLNPLREPTVDGCSDWRFSEEETKDLLEQIKKKVKILPDPSGSDSRISFLMALRKLRRDQIGMGLFIEAIHQG